mmetsp:Transcript_47098/g.86372  ORF Transcript_47098/g.86372 Transcript_47098/m.86372 type:complete len:408 (-) Transcript_47098:134-1357(-)
METVLQKKRAAAHLHQPIGVQASEPLKRRVARSDLSSRAPPPKPSGKRQASPRRNGNKAHIEERCLAMLHKLLAQLPRDKRRQVLAKNLSELQRRALEQWMLRPREQKLVMRQPPREVMPKRKLLDARKLKNQAQPAQRVLLNPSGIASVQVHGYRYYYAYMNIDGLELESRRLRDADKVQHFHSALVLIKDRLKATAGPLEVTLRLAIDEGLTASAVSLADMGLKFKVVARFLWIGRPLRSRAFSVSSEMEVGLRFWRRLLVARNGGVEVRRGRKNVLNDVSPDKLQQAWCEFKSEYANLLQASPRQTGQSVMQRVQALEDMRNRHFERQLENWNLKQMRAEEQQQRDWQHALQRGTVYKAMADQSDQSKQLLEDDTGSRMLLAQKSTTKVEQRIFAVLQRWTKAT